MKWFLACLFCIGCVAGDGGYSFKIHRKNYTLSTEFEIDSETEELVSSVYSQRIRIMTGYDLYNRYGVCEMKASESPWCMGIVYSEYVEINLYEPTGEWFGKIDGQVFTRGASARYQILDRDGNVQAIASLDKEKLGFTITHPSSYQHVIARLERVFIPELPDHWKVMVYEPDELDRRFIQIFAAFALNRQGDFREDT